MPGRQDGVATVGFLLGGAPTNLIAPADLLLVRVHNEQCRMEKFSRMVFFSSFMWVEGLFARKFRQRLLLNWQKNYARCRI